MPSFQKVGGVFGTVVDGEFFASGDGAEGVVAHEVIYLVDFVGAVRVAAVVVEPGEAEADDAGLVVQVVAVGLAGGGFAEFFEGGEKIRRLFEEFVGGDGRGGKDSPPVQWRPPHGELGGPVRFAAEHGGGGHHLTDSSAATRAASSWTALISGAMSSSYPIERTSSPPAILWSW